MHQTDIRKLLNTNFMSLLYSYRSTKQQSTLHISTSSLCVKTLVFVFGIISCGKNAVCSLQVNTCAVCLLYYSVVVNKTASTAMLTISLTISTLAHKKTFKYFSLKLYYIKLWKILFSLFFSLVQVLQIHTHT
jgi:hypothetical protein